MPFAKEVSPVAYPELQSETNIKGKKSSSQDPRPSMEIFELLVSPIESSNSSFIVNEELENESRLKLKELGN